MEEVLNIDKQTAINWIEMLAPHVMSILKAILVLAIGWWVIGKVGKGFSKMLEKSRVDDNLKPFLKTILSAAMKVMLLIAVIGMLGVQTSSFVAILGAAGLAVGLALQGSLSNFAGGVIILLLKPFKVGEFIDAGGRMGTVKEIQVFHTMLTTIDNRLIIIPNGELANSSVVNFSRMGDRRLDLTFNVAYGSNIEEVKQLVLEIVHADERVLREPAEPFVRMGNMGDSALDIVTRVWVDGANYWPLHFDLVEKVYNTFTAKGINIPFPQMDVHVFDKK
jgi:small conductance mechanosensitive channel